MCKYVSTAPLDCIGAFTCPSIGVHEHTQCYTCSEARRPGRSECGQNVNNVKTTFTMESCRKCFPPKPEQPGEEAGIGSGDGTVSGNAVEKGTAIVSGNGVSDGNAVTKGTRTVNGSITGNVHGHVSNKGTPTVNSSAAGTVNGNGTGNGPGKAAMVPSMAWIKERGKGLTMVKEAAMAKEAVMKKGTVKPGPIEGSGNKGAMAREAVMITGTVKPGSVEGSGNKDIAMQVPHH